MKVRVLSHRDVRALLPMEDAIALMEEAFVALAGGDAVQPLRMPVRLPGDRGLLGLMPAYLGGRFDAPGVKAVTVFPSNHGTAYDGHQGPIVLFEGRHGAPVAIVDGSTVTAIRTAAVSGLATRTLARPGAGRLAILGSGVQAASHLRAMRAVRPIGEVRVWSRTPARADAFARWSSRSHGIPVAAVARARDAVEGAALVCTTTSSREPVLEGAWLAPGAHVNAVGACTPEARELDDDAIVRAALFTDRRESLLAESGAYLHARDRGRIGDDHLRAELGDVVAGRAPGRLAEDEITVFESLGLGVEDVAAAHEVHARALARGVGTDVELGARRDEL